MIVFDRSRYHSSWRSSCHSFSKPRVVWKIWVSSREQHWTSSREDGLHLIQGYLFYDISWFSRKFHELFEFEMSHEVYEMRSSQSKRFSCVWSNPSVRVAIVKMLVVFLVIFGTSLVHSLGEAFHLSESWKWLSLYDRRSCCSAIFFCKELEDWTESISSMCCFRKWTISVYMEQEWIACFFVKHRSHIHGYRFNFTLQTNNGRGWRRICLSCQESFWICISFCDSFHRTWVEMSLVSELNHNFFLVNRKSSFCGWTTSKHHRKSRRRDPSQLQSQRESWTEDQVDETRRLEYMVVSLEVSYWPLLENRSKLWTTWRSSSHHIAQPWVGRTIFLWSE